MRKGTFCNKPVFVEQNLELMYNCNPFSVAEYVYSVNYFKCFINIYYIA